MKVLNSWITGRPNGRGYLASVSMDIEFEDGFMIQFRSMRLIETKENKVVLVMPNIKDSSGRWQDIFLPLNPRTREALEKEAISAWSKLWPSQETKEILEPL